MKTVLLCAALFLPLHLVAQSPLKTPRKSRADAQVYEVTQNGQAISLSYIDLKECAAKFERDAKLNRWSEAERVEEMAKIPTGGYLYATWGRTIIEAASADNFSVLVESSSGEEVLRWKPDASVPRSLTLMNVTAYGSSTMVPLKNPLADGTRVFIIEQGAHKRYEYLIHP